jgi:ribosomal protein S6
MTSVENLNDEQLIDEKKAYEIGYLLTPLLPEEKVEEVLENTFRASIEAAGGELTDRFIPKIRTLAYPVPKMIGNKKSVFTEAYFSYLRFKCESTKVHKVKEALDKSEHVLRYLIIVAPKHSSKPANPRRLSQPKAAEDKKGDDPKMSKADIDKEIEGLLTSVE